MFERLDYEKLQAKIEDTNTVAELKKLLYEWLEEDQKLLIELSAVLRNLNSDNVRRLNFAKTTVGNASAADIATRTWVATNFTPKTQ